MFVRLVPVVCVWEMVLTRGEEQSRKVGIGFFLAFGVRNEWLLEIWMRKKKEDQCSIGLEAHVGVWRWGGLVVFVYKKTFLLRTMVVWTGLKVRALF